MVRSAGCAPVFREPSTATSRGRRPDLCFHELLPSRLPRGRGRARRADPSRCRSLKALGSRGSHLLGRASRLAAGSGCRAFRSRDSDLRNRGVAPFGRRTSHSSGSRRRRVWLAEPPAASRCPRRSSVPSHVQWMVRQSRGSPAEQPVPAPGGLTAWAHPRSSSGRDRGRRHPGALPGQPGEGRLLARVEPAENQPPSAGEKHRPNRYTRFEVP